MSSSDEWAPPSGGESSAESSDGEAELQDEVVIENDGRAKPGGRSGRAAGRGKAAAGGQSVLRLQHRRQAISSDTEEEDDDDPFAALRDSDSDSDVELVSVSSQREREAAARDAAIDLSQDASSDPPVASKAAQPAQTGERAAGQSSEDDGIDLDLSDCDETRSRLSRKHEPRGSAGTAAWSRRQGTVSESQGDEVSDDAFEEPPPRCQPSRRARGNFKRQEPRVRARRSHRHSDDDSDYSAQEDNGEYEDDDLAIEPSQSSKLQGASMSSRESACKCTRYEFNVERRKYVDPDTGEVAVDEITDEDLFKTHVCWRSPDETSQMCFNLSTLKKIALTKSQWMAPPHFRSPMDQALKQQIVERFGHEHLSLPTRASMDTSDLDSFMRSYHAWLHRRLNDLSDLYVCPVCYTWVQRQNCDCDYSGGLPEVSEDDPMVIIQRSNEVSVPELC